MKIIGRILLVILSIGISFYAFGFLDFKVKGILLDKGSLVDSLPYLLAFYTHVSLGGIALIIGPFQFFPKWRRRRMSWHRNMGKLYVLSCLLGGVAGLSLAFFANGGIGNTFGFGLLALFWLWTTTQAYRYIRRGKVELHRYWMIRSFSLTLAAVTLRLYLPLLMSSGLEFESAYRLVSWLCWIPNLLVAEWMVRKMQSEVVASGGRSPMANG